MSHSFCRLTGLVTLLLLGCALSAADDEKSKSSKPTGALTFLGTVKGGIVKVSDGGNKITVRYKEMVPTSQTIYPGGLSRVGGASSKFRAPSVKEWGLKEKSQDLEVRVMDKAIIRVLNSKDLPSEDKSKKKKDAEEGKEGDDEAAMKSKEKPASKSAKKTPENNLPGKAGDPGSLAKGQVIILNVVREDFASYNRLVTNTIYIMGEK